VIDAVALLRGRGATSNLAPFVLGNRRAKKAKPTEARAVEPGVGPNVLLRFVKYSDYRFS